MRYRNGEGNTRPVGFLGVDVLCDLEMDGIVGFVDGGVAGPCDEDLEGRDFQPAGGSSQHGSVVRQI